MVRKRFLASAGLFLLAIFGVSTCVSTPNRDETVHFGTGLALVHIPADHSRTGVVVLHSYRNTAREPIRQGWTRVSNEHGFVAIYPDNGGGSWNAGLCCGEAMRVNRDDASWLARLIAMMRVRYGLSTVYLSGFSNGGMMVERLVAEHPGVADRIAVWGAAPEMPRSGRWSGVDLLYDGAGDRTIPDNGGRVRIGTSEYTIRPEVATSHWLIGGHVESFRVTGYGHAPEPNWPEVAWKALSEKSR
jgi:poly(3-hydroxybutyrate) depolymerase